MTAMISCYVKRMNVRPYESDGAMRTDDDDDDDEKG